MKKMFFAVILTALALVSCHQPTKEEQQIDNVKEAVMKHVNATLAYPKGAEITDKWMPLYSKYFD